MDSAGDDFSMHLRRAYLAMHRRANANFARHGVTADQYVVLTALADRGEMTQQDLVRRLHSDPNTLRAIVIRMEGLGLLERKPHATDGRAKAVSLTEQGVTTQHVLWELNEGFQRKLEGLFKPTELKAFLTFLGRVTRAMGAEGLGARSCIPSAECDDSTH